MLKILRLTKILDARILDIRILDNKILNIFNI